ncbi:hypothetical protein SAY86_010232 [Trapa natans]|uniref:C3HC-type domain-containing protein n=1 Tax=Trapa natans TaxID=22666 RepID=A0AAN7L6A0_TRANT|nr:hypothetical protein SAY86_010232 [Trapa natans]
MAEDSEKRFHSIMDKLFQSPGLIPKASSASPSSSPSSMQSLRGKKRPHSTLASCLLDPKMGLDDTEEGKPSAGISQAPLCRPWDRGDLIRRLSTFKSMTWFAKPKVVSAVNCARRGWVNVDMDTIACEACGARIFFSISSSCSREQVEKAALVFSLKLDNGHKLFCPWIDNTCDETLAQFPPTTPQVLADQYRERSTLLAHLLALPVISLSAIKFIRSPQLDQFLQQSSLLVCGDGSSEIPSMKMDYHENGSDTRTADLYYQALKLISLCGWETRIVPYLVNCRMNPSNQTVEDDNVSNSSKILYGREKSIICIPTTDNSPIKEVDGAFGVSSEPVADPKSVVLDCKLCGASVGLWAFFTVPRPLEVFRFISFTGINNEKISSGQDTTCGRHNGQNSALETNVPSSNLNMSIAGGLPSTQQNFKAVISFPIIGQSIRRHFSSDADIKSCLLFNEENSQSELRSIPASLREDECNKINGDTSGSLPPSVSDSPTAGSHRHEKDYGNSIHLGGMKGTSTHPNDIHGEVSSQSNTLVSQNDSRGHLANYNGDTSTVVVASDQADERDASEMTVECNRELSSHKNATYEYPVLNGEPTRTGAAEKGMEFDPIRQHRHFCPWIASTGGVVPGWQQVLSALQRQEEDSHLSPTSPPPTSLIKVDDPVTTVRRLFMSKRMKSSQE